MSYDEFAFFNQQLAAMLRDGIPLEGALKQLCLGMKTGRLRHELQQLEADLASGTQLTDALRRRELPVLYRQMIEVGVRSNDLPGVLTLLADHYHRANALWTRLKGLLVYPVIVVVVSLGLTLLLSLTFSNYLSTFFDQLGNYSRPKQQIVWIISTWVPPILMAMLLLAGIAIAVVPGWRGRMRWRLPAFREASLAQLASALALLLKNGTPLAEALALAEAMEANTPAGKTLGHWRQLVQGGHGKPSEWPMAAKPIPPMFLWLVQRSEDDPAAGFMKAAEIYQARAAYRIELALYGALPISILLLGQMVFWQVAPLMRSMVWLMNAIGAVGN